MPKSRLSWQARTALAVSAVAVIMAVGAVRLLAVAYAQEGEAGLRAHETVTITGRVSEPDGNPVAGCEVLAQYRRPDGLAAERTQSDAAGAFAFALADRDPQYPIKVAARKPGLAVAWQVVEDTGQVTLKLGAEPVSCAGTVTDPEGNPIEGAQVFVVLLKRTEKARSPDEFLRVNLFLKDEAFLSDGTDREGRFEVPDLPPEQHVTLTAVGEGWERVRLSESVPAGKQDIEFVLRPEVAISGRVTHQGKPVAGMSLAVCSATGMWAARTVTNEDGRYGFQQLPPDAYYVLFEPPEDLITQAVGPVRLKAGEHFTEGDAALTPGGLVRGKVTEPATGQPVAGAHVRAFGPSRPREQGRGEGAETDEHGNYELRLAAGMNTIQCLGKEKEFPWQSAEPRERVVQVVEERTVSGADFLLTRRDLSKLRVGGRVLGPDGEPAAGIKVAAIGAYYAKNFGELFRWQTGAEGEFELPLEDEPGPNTWSVLAVDPHRELAGITYLDEPSDDVEIHLKRGGYLVGTVVDREGKPVPNMQASIAVSHGGGFYQGINGPLSDEAGRMVIGPLPSGVGLWLSPGGGTARFVSDDAWDELREITLAPRQRYELPALVLNLAGRSLSGLVIDAQRRPVKNATVFASRTDETARTNDLGVFELKGVPARGQLWVVAVHPDEPLFCAERVDPDETPRVELTVQPLGGASGQVVDQQGRPASGAKVSLHPREHAWRIVQTLELLQRLAKNSCYWEAHADEQGKWRVEGLIAGAEYEVFVYPPGGKYGHPDTSFTAEGGQVVDVGTTRIREDWD